VQDIGVIIYQPCCDVRSKSSGKREPLRKKKMKRAPLISRRTFLTLAITGTVAVCYPVFIERQLVQINRYQIRVAGLPAPFKGFTIAHLTDIHLGLLVSDSFVKNVVKKTNLLGTDAIVCTGDYVHARNSTDEIDRVWDILSTLKAPEGVYSVLGNHDHWADGKHSLYRLEESGQNVRHQNKAIVRGDSRVIIGGSGDLIEDKLGIDEAFAGVSQEQCKILLSHNPDSLDSGFTSSVALTICGHTHGGQVSLPFFGPPVLPVRNKKYSSGIIASNKGPLFISRGIGWAILPVRFNCYPEIAILELT
jgi:predicted MPP superfamily phosphohydrolase